MANIVIYNPTDEVVANRVINYIISANTPEYDYEPYKIVNPDLSGISTPPKYWKVKEGRIVEEMTEEEKELIESTYYPIKKEKMEIINELWNSFESLEQALRIEAALKDFPFFLLHLESYDYLHARENVERAYNQGKITEEDKNLILSKIPEV